MGTDKDSAIYAGELPSPAEAMDEELIHQELSESIIGAAMHVLNVLKPLLDEKLYGLNKTFCGAISSSAFSCANDFLAIATRHLD